MFLPSIVNDILALVIDHPDATQVVFPLLDADALYVTARVDMQDDLFCFLLGPKALEHWRLRAIRKAKLHSMEPLVVLHSLSCLYLYPFGPQIVRYVYVFDLVLCWVGSTDVVKRVVPVLVVAELELSCKVRSKYICRVDTGHNFKRQIFWCHDSRVD